MALKHKLKTLDDLDEATQALYKKVGEEYVLDVEGIEEGDTAGLKAKVEELLAEKKESERKAAEAAANQKKAEEEAARKAGDIEALEKGWKEKFDALEAKVAERDVTISSMKTETENKELDSAALRIASGLADGDNQQILSRFVRDRLRYEDGQVKVTDREGNLTISTTEQLADEIRGDKQFASLVTGSKGTGSGATGGDKSGAGGTGKEIDWGGASVADKVAAVGQKLEAQG